MNHLLYKSNNGWIATLFFPDEPDFVTEYEFGTYFEVESKEQCH